MVAALDLGSSAVRRVGSSPMGGTMKYILIILFYLLTTNASAQIIIGFKGKHSIFDQKAFYQYANARNLKPVVLEANEVHRALQIIKAIDYYELYGYSLGAASVVTVVKSAKSKPRLVVTIAAYRGLDLDFAKYNIPFYNFFDYSSIPTTSPGYYINSDHWTVQQIAVNILVTGL